MDGDYVFRNFGISEDIKIVSSTDELLLVSFTPEKERPGNISESSLRPKWYKTFPVISKFWKISRIRWMLNSGNVDPLKRKNLIVPVFFKICDVPESDWKKVSLHGLSIIKSALAPKGYVETLSIKFIEYVNKNTSWPFRLLNPVQNIEPPNSGSKIVNSSGVGSHETRVITPLLTSGKWYWEIHSPNLGALSGALMDTATFGFVKAGVSGAALLGNVNGSWGWHPGSSQGEGTDSTHTLIFCEGSYIVRVAVNINKGKAWVGLNNNVTAIELNTVPTFERLPPKIYGALTSTHGKTGTAEIFIKTEKNDCVFFTTRWIFPYRKMGFIELSLKQKEIALFFNVVVWGEEFRGYLTQLLLPSLLAPKNIPGLKNRDKSKFIFVAPLDDWDKIKLSHSFKLLSDLIDIVYFEIPTPMESDNKHLVMSEGHKLASQFTFDAKAQGVFVTPDLMLSDGAVTALEKRAEEGFQAVLCFAIRFGLEGCLRDVGERFDLPAEVPISIKPRDLAKIAIDNLHIESKRYIFNTDYFADVPWSLILTKQNLQGILLHTFSWCPLLLDYSTIQRHDVSVFEQWTLDGDYVFRNFGAEAKVHVVQDSDEIMLASFTPEDDLPNVAFDPYIPHWQKYLLIPFFWSLAESSSN